MLAPTQTRTDTPPVHGRRTERVDDAQSPQRSGLTEQTGRRRGLLITPTLIARWPGAVSLGQPEEPRVLEGSSGQSAGDGVAATSPSNGAQGRLTWLRRPGQGLARSPQAVHSASWPMVPSPPGSEPLKPLLLLPAPAPHRRKGAPFHNPPNKSRPESCFPLVLAPGR